MLEYGACYNNISNTIMKYPFCAFHYEDRLFISNAIQSEVIVCNSAGETIYCVKYDHWFPRWIQPISNSDFLFVDSKKGTIGLVSDRTIIKEEKIPMSKPSFVSVTQWNTFLVGGKGDKPLLEYDFDFNIIGKYLNNDFNIQSAEYVNEKMILICDIDRHQVLLCDQNGDIKWEYGRNYFPGEYADELSTPKYSTHYDNLIYIADGKNNRILCVDWDKNIKFIYNQDEDGQILWWPTCIQKSEGNLIITDSGNNRVIELKSDLSKLKQLGEALIKKFELDNPRCIEIVDNHLFIADTYNHRILESDNNLNVSVFFGGKRGCGKDELFWPRAIRYKGNNKFIVADSRNSRIIEIDKENNVHFTIYGYTMNNSYFNFGDPHDIDSYEDKILITDSILNQVVEIDMSGNCTWIYGRNGELKNPHHARRTSDGNILISDTENNRVIKVSYTGEIIYEIRHTSNGFLNEPRWSEEINETILITDAGNNRVILAKFNGDIIKEYGETASSMIDSIRAPRCARMFNDLLLISDTYNNRVILDDF